MKLFAFLFCSLLLFSCNNSNKQPLAQTPIEGLITKNAMVVSAREEASKIGTFIMEEKGGNAFDAMIATELALAVAYPYAGNLGGGGFMVYRTQHGEIGSLDYREKAPIKASRDMYLDSEGNYISQASKVGGLAVGVPGTIAGMFAVHEKLGTLPMEEILAPVVALAQNGFKITQAQAERFNTYAPIFKEVNDTVSIYTQTWRAGDTLKNEALANTLLRISENGMAGFYKGKTAQILAKYIQDKGGIITENDLTSYEATWREPITFTYKDLRIISMGPPSSGGICLGQMMTCIAPLNIKKHNHNRVKAMQAIVEVSKRAYADRSKYLGDPDFVDVPIETLLSEEYLNNRMANYNFNKATPSSEIAAGEILGYESTETTHYSIVDSFGNAIAATTTLNAAFGSKLYVNELGFFLNNEMDDFSAKPGEPNMFGLLGGSANAIAPQKRMLSSMTPTIVEKNGEFWMSVGTPGGSTIITSVFQTIINVYEFDMTMQQAVDAPRFHHQWFPDTIKVEPDGFQKTTLDSLRTMGYTIDEKNAPVIGKVDAILRKNDGTLEGGADRRGDDKAVGY